MMAARIKQLQAFMALTQMLVMPLFFLPGVMYPPRSVPAWLASAHPVRPGHRRRLPMRHEVFGHPSVSPAAAAEPSPAVTWNGRAAPLGLSRGLVA